MAAYIARSFYSLCSSSGFNVSLPLCNFTSAKLRLTRSVLSRVCYGNRGSDYSQDVHVHIPVERLTVSYSRSSGPGGQHVNKGRRWVGFRIWNRDKNLVVSNEGGIGAVLSTVSIKAEVRFHVRTADWIPEDVRQKIVEKHKNRINKAGELLVTSEVSRSQQRNLSDCLQKISAILAEAGEKPREPSTEDVALRAARIEKRNKERLRQKKILSAVKNSRRVDFD